MRLLLRPGTLAAGARAHCDSFDRRIVRQYVETLVRRSPSPPIQLSHGPPLTLSRACARPQVNANVPPTSISIISPYNAQVVLLASLVHPQYPDVEIGSVDSNQGRENGAPSSLLRPLLLDSTR